ncbi:MAG: hypothetical protein KIG62_11125 [Oscillospiraceae bacterium]|nr:hypothetical protein [Oscillospiraceae bacterium]
MDNEVFGCQKVVEIMEQIHHTLEEYEKQTDSMVNADLETLQRGLIARNELIETLEDLKLRLDEVVNFEQDEEHRLLKALVNGSYVNAQLDDDHKKIQFLQRSILIVKQRILDKDAVISGQFRNQSIDSRNELAQLKQTKQKIGYYNSATVNRATGQSLNKNL